VKYLPIFEGVGPAGSRPPVKGTPVRFASAAPAD
jgi:hypothetical protein